MRNKTIFTLLAVVLFVLAAGAGYFGPDWWRDYRNTRAKADFVPAGVPKSVLADFSGQFNNVDVASEPMRLPDIPFKDANGKNIRISGFEGKPTLVNLWATWCAPCVVELPELDKFARQYGDRLNVIGVALEQGKTAPQIADFLKKRELVHLAAYVDENGEFAQKLKLRGIPTSFLIGSDGLILYRFEGEAVWTSRESKAFFDIFLLQNR